MTLATTNSFFHLNGRLRSVILASVAALALGGCSLLAESPADTFDLSAPTKLPGGQGSMAQLLVPEPTAVKALDTERIVVRPSGSEINYFSGSQWSDRLPRLFQARLVQSFENSGRAKAGKPGQGLTVDYQVVTDIRTFEFNVANGKRAIIEISVKLLNDRSGRLVATQVFKSSVPGQTDGAKDAVAALDQALDKMLREIVAWTLHRV